MAKKKEEGEAQAPIWMVTMSDMNTLLMTFFIILFSMMVQDERLYMDLRDYFRQMSNYANPVEEGPNFRSPNISKVPDGEEPGSDEQMASSDQIPRPKHLTFQITRRTGRLVIHLDQKVGYEPGVYKLTQVQKEILDWVKKHMSGYRQNIVVAGFTDEDGLDGLVFEGQQIRALEPGDDNPDYFLLSSLRAQEVRRYLTRGNNPMDDRQVRVGEYGTRDAAKAAYTRDHNRRVEIIISSRLASATR